MNMLLEFLQMGGYAAYVWPAYGLTVAILLLNWHSVRRRLRRAVRCAIAEEGR